MTDYLYCISNPSVPGIVRVDRSNTDPRRALLEFEASGVSTQRLDWVIHVADGAAALAALRKDLSGDADPSWPGHYHCDPTRARIVATAYAAQRHETTVKKTSSISSLPSLVLGLGLAVQFLGMISGHTVGPSAALIASALFWVVYTLPIGSGGREKAQTV